MSNEKHKVITGEWSETQDRFYGYEEFQTKPKMIIAKKLDKAMTIQIEVNGTPQKLRGEAGYWHVKELKSGKESFYSHDEFLKKFKVQGELF